MRQPKFVLIPTRRVAGAYASSKAAVHALAETLTAEIAPLGIRVLLVEPGAFRTGIYGQEYLTSKPIADYNQMRSVSASRFASVSGTVRFSIPPLFPISPFGISWS
jgi:NAD(P)-dependent dehydrogenase (short-subunit alcohol dehydrogenase family)